MRRAAVALALCLTGCHSPITELVVQVRAEESLQLDRVTLAVVRGPNGTAAMREAALDESGATFVVVHREGSLGPLELDVRGLRVDHERARQALTLNFVAGRSVAVPVWLERACEDVSCPTDASCRAGVCTPVDRRDAGAPDSGAPDGALLDAGRSDAACVVELACDDDCECSEECGCAVRCEPGASCHPTCEADCSVDGSGARDLHVDCEAATCLIDASGAEQKRDIHCRDGSSCDVDCRGQSECTVKCESGSSCLVRCDGEDCSIEDCGDLDDDIDEGGELRSCGDGVFACRRSCP